MAGNRRVKEEMIRIFGPECFIEKLHIRRKEDIEKEKERYKGKSQLSIMDQLTYHHILERCRGGKATVENGALLKYINHQWLHRLPDKQKDTINEMFQEYKRNFYSKIRVNIVDDIDTGIEINFAELEVDDKGKVKGKKMSRQRKVFNKQEEKKKEKREMQRLRKEWEDR